MKTKSVSKSAAPYQRVVLIIACCLVSAFLAPALCSAQQQKRQLYTGTALLVIDVQKDIFPVARQEEVLKNINLLIERAEAAGVPVIYVYHSAGSLIPGEPGWFLHEAVRRSDGHEQIRKTTPNSFNQTELELLLDLRKIGRLVICGLASDGCVKATIQGAQSRGYDVILASDAHSTPTDPGEATIQRINAAIKGWGLSVIPAAEISFR